PTPQPCCPHARGPPAARDLRLARTARADALAAGDATARLPGHRLAPAAQARQEVLELRELHLCLALPGLRVLREDVQDERDAVDDLHLDDVLEAAPLTGRELRVDDHGVGADGRDDVPQLTGLAAAEVRSRIRLVALLQHPVEDGR